MACEDYGIKYPTDGPRYCAGCGRLAELASLEKWVYRNLAKRCAQGCETEPGVLYEAAALRTSLSIAFGKEWDALDRADRIRVYRDAADAYAEDDCDPRCYRSRIGAGNLASYAACLRAGSERSS